MNKQIKVTWKTLRTIAHSLMVHVRVSKAYNHLELMYTTDTNFLVLSIKDLINEDSEPTMLLKPPTGTKLSVSRLCMLFCPCVVWKYTTHVGKRALNMHHQA